jgi:hypothetical protein
MQPSVAKVNISSFRKNFLLVVLYTVLLENFSMKTIVLVLLFLGFGITSHSQQDTSLVNRVNQMLKLTQRKDIEKIMDYTYPKLFTIVPKEALMDAMKSAYDTDDFSIQLDSVNIQKIFPVFRINDTSYVKVKHTMLMKMKYKEPYDSAKKEEKEFMVSMMEEKFGKGKVRFDPVANSLNIFMTPNIVGIKSASSMWTFANLDESNPQMLNMLFSKQVLDKLKTYK